MVYSLLSQMWFRVLGWGLSYIYCKSQSYFLSDNSVLFARLLSFMIVDMGNTP